MRENDYIETLVKLIFGLVAIVMLASVCFTVYTAATGDYSTIEMMQRMNGNYIIIDQRNNVGQGR